MLISDSCGQLQMQLLTTIPYKTFGFLRIISWTHDTSDDKVYLGDNQNGQQNNLSLSI